MNEAQYALCLTLYQEYQRNILNELSIILYMCWHESLYIVYWTVTGYGLWYLCIVLMFVTSLSTVMCVKCCMFIVLIWVKCTQKNQHLALMFCNIFNKHRKICTSLSAAIFRIFNKAVMLLPNTSSKLI